MGMGQERGLLRLLGILTEFVERANRTVNKMGNRQWIDSIVYIIIMVMLLCSSFVTHLVFSSGYWSTVWALLRAILFRGFNVRDNRSRGLLHSKTPASSPRRVWRRITPGVEDYNFRSLGAGVSDMLWDARWSSWSPRVLAQGISIEMSIEGLVVFYFYICSSWLGGIGWS